MAFGLQTSLSALVPDASGSCFDFSVATTIKSVRLTNMHSASVTVSLWFDYDGTNAADIDKVLHNKALAPGESVILDGGPWNFAASSRITGEVSDTDTVSIHITPATI
jgi:hypothetical protein